MTDSTDINLEITPIELEDILNNPNLLIDRLRPQQLQQLQHYIFDTLTDKDGGPTIQKFQIKAFNYKESMAKGTFRLTFEIERQFCCSDVQSCQNDYIDFDFSYKDQSISMHATYFNWEVH